MDIECKDDEEEDDVKLEFEEEIVTFNEDRDFPAQALMTLHQSVQNLPKKHKSGLQEAVHDASPIKRSRNEEGFIQLAAGSHPHISTVETSHLSHLRFDPNNTSSRHYEPAFTPAQTRIMKGLFNNVRNILKLPSGRRWVYYEWFYSNIDRALLLGQNDFESCLQQLFRNLKTRNLTKIQWTMIRRLMGKPRRCSPAFFAEERIALEEKRKKIRYLHQLKGFEVKDMTQFKDLPEEIPMPMVIGTKVTAKVHPEGDGLHLFTGTVDAVDNINNTYRINFDRVGIGTHSVPDVEVASEDYEAMNLQLFIVKERPKIAGANSPPESYGGGTKNQRSDMITASPARIRLAEALNNDISGTFGGFPIRFLLYMTRLSKIIALKKKYVDKLKELNSEAELRKPLKRVRRDFQKTYAFVILELEKINNELNSIFEGIHNFVHNVAPQLGFFDESTTMKLQCDETAQILVEQSHRIVNNEQMKELVTKFTSLMLQITRFAENSHGAYELSSIDEAVKDIKSSLHDSNKKLFEDKVETGIAFIKNGLQEGGTMLDAFSNNTSKMRKEQPVHHAVHSSSEEEEVVDVDEEEEEELADEEEDDDDEDIEEEEEEEFEEDGEEVEPEGKFQLIA